MPSSENPDPFPDPRSDAELVDALNHNDPSAFDALYFRHRNYVARLALRFTRHEADALDVLQETFAYLARKFPGFHLTAALTTFLYPVVKNLSLAARRKRARFTSPAAVPETPAPPDPVASELDVLLQTLPEDHREIVLLRFVDNLTLEEIAQALAIPLGTAKSRLHHALKTLRESPQLKAYFAPE